MDGEITFDFERAMEAQQPPPAAQAPDTSQPTQPQPKNYRQTVCTYWLRGLCMKGDTCGFLHQFDPQRMPVCRTLLKFGVCKEPDCPYKHTLDEIKECNMYKLGFCIYGPACRFKHTRQQGPPPEPSRLEACKPRDVRNINLVANQANEGIAQQELARPTRRPRLTGPGDHRALPASGSHPANQQLVLPSSYPQRPQQQGAPYGAQRPGPPGASYQQMQGVPLPRPPPPPMQQQQQHYGGPQQQQPFGRPQGIDPSVLASVGQANLPYGF